MTLSRAGSLLSAISLGLLLVSASIGSTALAAEDITLLVGTVSAEGMLLEESGDKYLVTRTEMGEQLLKESGQKVLVTGEVSDKAGTKMITVSSYQPWMVQGVSGKPGGSED